MVSIDKVASDILFEEGYAVDRPLKVYPAEKLIGITEDDNKWRHDYIIRADGQASKAWPGSFTSRAVELRDVLQKWMKRNHPQLWEGSKRISAAGPRRSRWTREVVQHERLEWCLELLAKSYK